MFVIKAIYPQGSHIVSLDGGRLRFQDRLEAEGQAEVLNRAARNAAGNVTYIVLEESI